MPHLHFHRFTVFGDFGFSPNATHSAHSALSALRMLSLAVGAFGYFRTLSNFRIIDFFASESAHFAGHFAFHKSEPAVFSIFKIQNQRSSVLWREVDTVPCECAPKFFGLLARTAVICSPSFAKSAFKTRLQDCLFEALFRKKERAFSRFAPQKSGIGCRKGLCACS